MSANSGIKAFPVAMLIGGLALLPNTIFAATTCTMAVTPVAFGSYDVSSTTARDTSGTIVVTCRRSGGPSPTVTIAIGPGMYGGTIATRKMKQNAGSDLLSYNLFQDAAKTALWGDVIGTNAFRRFLAVPNNGSAQLTATVFGRIPAGQDVTYGSYSDSVLVSLLP
jgi:spore coat protein U-like protein